MTADVRRTGVILAGGRSTRFEGDDKALASLDGEPLVRHVASALAPVVDELVVNCRSEQADELTEAVGDLSVPLVLAFDPIRDRGPLFGLRTALRHANGAYALAAPCDMPWLSTPLLEHLLSQAVGATGAALEWERCVRPFPIAVHVGSGLVSCSELLRAGRREFGAFLSSLGPVVVDERVARAHGAPAILRDVDVRSDLPDPVRRPDPSGVDP